MIGLVDVDLFSSSKLTLPNLEIMKLASYYQKEEKEFVRLIPLKETNLSGYKKIYLRSDNPENEIPYHFYQADNVDFGGLAFSKGIHIPFENRLINFAIPSTSIYKEFLREKMIEGVPYQDINAFLDNCYVRLFDGEQLPIPPVRHRKKVYIYDDNLIAGNWEKAIQKISDRKPSSIITINPIRCETVKQFLDIRKYTRISRINKIVLDFNVPVDELPILINKYYKTFLAEITPSSEIYLPFGEKRNSANNKLTYADDLYRSLNTLYSFWSKKIPIKMSYELFSISDTNPYHDLYCLIENWSNLSTPKKKETNLENKIKTKEQKEAYELFLKFYPRQKKLFTQNFSSLSERGYWRP